MLLIIGGGKMGTALLDGLSGSGREVAVVEQNPSRRDELSQLGHTVLEQPVACEGAIIAVKPKDVEFAVSDAVAAGASRVLSIAAGVSLHSLHVWAGPHVPVFRAMPNLGAVVQRSATAVCSGSTASAEDLDWAVGVLEAVGRVTRVNEDQMDAVTGLSGSGPAYFFLIAEALVDAGVSAGLPNDIATALTVETMAGAAQLLSESGSSAAALRANVTTPAGTTAAALRVLEQRAVRGALIDAVAAAAGRSGELGHPVSGH